MRVGGRKAFTLIELLTAMTIIAVLASILLPAFAVARESSRRSLCATNLHGIGVAFANYVCRHAVYPTYGSSATDRASNYFVTDSSTVEDWTALYVGKYLGSAAILYCPSMTHKAHQYDTPQNPWPVGQARTCYSRRYFSGATLSAFTRVDQGQALAADLLFAPSKLMVQHEIGCNVLYQSGMVLFRQDVLSLFEAAGVSGAGAAGNAQLDQVWEGLDLR